MGVEIPKVHEAVAATVLAHDIGAPTVDGGMGVLKSSDALLVHDKLPPVVADDMGVLKFFQTVLCGNICGVHEGREMGEFIDYDVEAADVETDVEEVDPVSPQQNMTRSMTMKMVKTEDGRSALVMNMNKTGPSLAERQQQQKIAAAAKNDGPDESGKKLFGHSYAQQFMALGAETPVISEGYRSPAPGRRTPVASESPEVAENAVDVPIVYRHPSMPRERLPSLQRASDFSAAEKFLEEGCVGVYFVIDDSANGGTAQMVWSSVRVEGAFSFARPAEGIKIPAYKYIKSHKEELCRHLRGSNAKYMESWVIWIRRLQLVNASFVFLPAVVSEFKDALSLALHFSTDEIQFCQEGDNPMDLSTVSGDQGKLDAVAALPILRKAKFIEDVEKECGPLVENGALNIKVDKFHTIAQLYGVAQLV